MGHAELARSYARQLLNDLLREQPSLLAGLAPIVWPQSVPLASRSLACLDGMTDSPLPSLAIGALAALGCIAPRARLPNASRLIAMRTRTHGLRGQGTISAGGSCRLLATADGRLAVNLARPDDWAMLPAWLECGVVADWTALSQEVARRSTPELVARGREMGLAVANAQPSIAAGVPWRRASSWRAPAGSVNPQPLVLDLSSLWAGPLCTALLRRCGARVIKVEHPQRQDGARRGPAWFFQAMNGGKEFFFLDWREPQQRAVFEQLLQQADIVVEGLRPRVLRQLGIVAEDWLAERPGRSWISLTGYGREPPQGDWIAYGDDAAVAAGLSQWHFRQTGQWQFCGDAIADPLSGVHGALAVWAAHLGGGGKLIDLAMCDVVAAMLAFAAKAAPTAALSPRL